MPKQPPAQEFSRFDFRPGVKGFPRWRGLNKNNDPATIPSNQLWDAINIRLDNGTIVSRGGQSKYNAAPFADCIDGIFDMDGEDNLQPGVMLSCGLVWAYDPGTDYSITDAPVGVFSHVNDVGTGLYPSSTVEWRILPSGNFHGVLGGDFDSDSQFYPRRNLVKFNGSILGLLMDYNENYTDPAFVDWYLGRIGATTGNVNPMANIGERVRDMLVVPERVGDDVTDVLYMGTVDSGVLWRYDTTAGLVQDTTGLTADYWILENYRDFVYLIGPNAILKRTAAGATSSVSLPGGLNNFYPTDTFVYQDKLYISGFDTVTARPAVSYTAPVGKILVYDGTTCSVARTPLSEIAISLCGFNDYLYYGYGLTLDDGSGSYYVGRYDGSSWADTHAGPLKHNGTNGVPAVGDPQSANSVVPEYLTTDGNSLYISGTHIYDDSSLRNYYGSVQRTDRDSTSSTRTVEAPQDIDGNSANEVNHGYLLMV